MSQTRLYPSGQLRPVDLTASTLGSRRVSPGLCQQKCTIFLRNRNMALDGFRKESGKMAGCIRELRCALASSPVRVGGVQYKATVAGARLEVVALVGRDHNAVARIQFRAPPLYLQFQNPFQAPQDLEMIMRMAAVRRAVASHGKF